MMEMKLGLCRDGSWRAEQIIINTPKTLDDYAFRSDDEDEAYDPNKGKKRAGQQIQVKKTTSKW